MKDILYISTYLNRLKDYLSKIVEHLILGWLIFEFSFTFLFNIFNYKVSNISNLDILLWIIWIDTFNKLCWKYRIILVLSLSSGVDNRLIYCVLHQNLWFWYRMGHRQIILAAGFGFKECFLFLWTKMRHCWM